MIEFKEEPNSIAIYSNHKWVGYITLDATVKLCDVSIKEVVELGKELEKHKANVSEIEPLDKGQQETDSGKGKV